MKCNKYFVIFTLVFLLFTGCSTQPSYKPFDSQVPTPTIVPITLEDLESALFTLSDMPPGWTMIPPVEEKKDEEETTYTFLCMEFEKRAIGNVQRVFKKSELSLILIHELVLYPKGLASSAFQDVVSASKACTEYTTSLDNDLELTYSLTSLSFPMLGEGTIAISATEEFPIFGFRKFDSIYILVGQVILRITYAEIGLDVLDIAKTEAFAREALEKLLTIYSVYIE